MLAAFTALNDVAVEMRKDEEEAKAAVERCEEVESRLSALQGLRYLCWGGFDEPLATLEAGFTVLANALVAALEAADTQMDKTLESECRDLFFVAATRFFSHLHLRDPGFDMNSVIVPVPPGACDRTAE
ncbi:hypothetical protein D1007_21231 [Hordeum vulgare]|nr:hypothetical protein D1007_21231 [Hordeum vulgare]